MCTVHKSFVLKRSRIQIAFQLMIFIVLFYFFYQLLSLFLFCLFVVLGLIIFYYFYKRRQVEYFAHLDQNEWSLKYFDQDNVYRVIPSKFLDHQLYIVVYFKNKTTKNMIVWCDQLEKQQWKQLKVLVKLF